MSSRLDIQFEELLAKMTSGFHHLPQWRTLIELSHYTRNAMNIKRAYTAALKSHPTTVFLQISYLRHLVAHQDHNETMMVYQDLAKNSTSVDIYRSYLEFMRYVRKFPLNVDKVYEAALDSVGCDPRSGDIWMGYIKFLCPVGASAVSQHDDKLQNLLFQAICTPLFNIDDLWTELEHHLKQKYVAKSIVAQRLAALLPIYTTARRVSKEIAKYTAAITEAENSVGPWYLGALPTFCDRERILVGKWKSYLRWEESNPMGWLGSDESLWQRRVSFAYNQAFCTLSRFPEIWFMAYSWNHQNGRRNEAMKILSEALLINPSSYLLRFAHMEALELENDGPGVDRTISAFILSLSGQLSSFVSNKNPPTLSHEDQDLQEQIAEYGLVYIMWMRCMLRLEGLLKFRSVFLKAVQDPLTPWSVYEAAAYIEYHKGGGIPQAYAIFENGLTRFKTEVGFVQRYLGFLISLNDDFNARAVFEKTVHRFTPEDATPLWNLWFHYQSEYMPLDVIAGLKERRPETLTSCNLFRNLFIPEC
ncbi:hypothetical protein EV421DRAFT_1717305 [Armillaria borealis]|uniref:mRNA 3'-end-processing protein RNA14 n=1 Tax=Armillaria borealis TaxID=47425 RepID=A0AA39MH56_9AGAR|nr:hypothetical protein EV421DRAFT_1717305 [Armillaria borealis]